MPTSPRKCAHTCQPLQPPRLPSCAQNFSHNLTHSLAISRVSLVHLYVPLTFQSIGQRDNSYRLPAARIHCDSPAAHARRPRSAPSPPPLIIPITQSRKSQFRQMPTNPRKCAHTCATPSTPAPDATHCPHPQIFFREQKNTSIHAAIRATSRQFDTHLTHRQDTEQGIT